MKFEWDENKEQANIRKHHLDFATAATVFYDRNRIEWYDKKHSTMEEDRYITIGRVGDMITVVAVAYTLRRNTIRIITAHYADKQEEEAYYGH